MKNLQNKLMLLAAILLLPNLLKAQGEEKLTIGIFPFSGASGEYNLTIYNIVSSCFEGKKRFIVVDRAKFNQITSERNLQKNEEFINGEVAKQGLSIGAKYIVTGDIIEARLDRAQCSHYNYTTKQNEYRPCYNFIVNMTIKLVDVETGAVLSSQNFNIKQEGNLLSNGYSSSEELAIRKTMNSVRGYVLAWINKSLPYEMKIVAIEELDKKGIVKTVLITGGADNDMSKGSDIYVKEVEHISFDGGTLERPKVVSTLKVLSVTGDIAVCKVTSNSEALHAVINEKKTLKLEIKSYN